MFKVVTNDMNHQGSDYCVIPEGSLYTSVLPVRHLFTCRCLQKQNKYFPTCYCLITMIKLFYQNPLVNFGTLCTNKLWAKLRVH